MLSHLKTFFQVLTVAAVLLTWAAFDHVVKEFRFNRQPMHITFNTAAPTEIFAGEIFNFTLDYHIPKKKNKEHFVTSGYCGLRCSNNLDGNISYTLDEWVMDSKFGQAVAEYNATHKDLRSSINEALCFITLVYSYYSTLDTTLIYNDKVMSTVFRYSTLPRPIPLPNLLEDDISLLTEKQILLTKQLRYSSADDKTQQLIPKQISSPSNITSANEPKLTLRHVPKEPTYNFFWIRDEDECDFCVIPITFPIFWVSLTVLIFLISKHPSVKAGISSRLQRLHEWFTLDINNSTSPHANNKRELNPGTPKRKNRSPARRNIHHLPP